MQIVVGGDVLGPILVHDDLGSGHGDLANVFVSGVADLLGLLKTAGEKHRPSWYNKHSQIDYDAATTSRDFLLRVVCSS